MNWWRKLLSEKRTYAGSLFYLYERGASEGEVRTFSLWMKRGEESDTSRLYRWDSSVGMMLATGITIGFCKSR